MTVKKLLLVILIGISAFYQNAHAMQDNQSRHPSEENLSLFQKSKQLCKSAVERLHGLTWKNLSACQKTLIVVGLVLLAEHGVWAQDSDNQNVTLDLEDDENAERLNNIFTLVNEDLMSFAWIQEMIASLGGNITAVLNYVHNFLSDDEQWVQLCMEMFSDTRENCVRHFCHGGVCYRNGMS